MRAVSLRTAFLRLLARSVGTDSLTALPLMRNSCSRMRSRSAPSLPSVAAAAASGSPMLSSVRASSSVRRKAVRSLSSMAESCFLILEDTLGPSTANATSKSFMVALSCSFSGREATNASRSALAASSSPISSAQQARSMASSLSSVCARSSPLRLSSAGAMAVS